MHKLQIGQYKGLNVAPPTKYTDSDLELAVIESTIKLTNQWAKKNKPVELGDEVIVTLQAECEGIFVPEFSQTNFKYVVGAPAMLEQFKEVLGKKEGETFQMEIVFPETAPVERVRGKKVTINGTVQELNLARQLAITDEIAKGIDPEVSGIDELQSKLRKIIESNWQQMMDQNTIDIILNTIIANSKYEFDEEEFNKVYQAIITDTQKKMFSVTDQKVLELLLTSNHEEQFYKDCRMMAERNILENLVINEIIKLENIEISVEELEVGKDTIKQMLQDEVDFQSKFPTEDVIKNYLLREKTLNLLLKWNSVN